MKYCMDCGNYVPGGGEHNCIYPYPVRQSGRGHVCAIQEACEHFIEKADKEDIGSYPKIVFKKLKRRKK